MEENVRKIDSLFPTCHADLAFIYDWNKVIHDDRILGFTHSTGIITWFEPSTFLFAVQISELIRVKLENAQTGRERLSRLVHS